MLFAHRFRISGVAKIRLDRSGLRMVQLMLNQTRLRQRWRDVGLLVFMGNAPADAYAENGEQNQTAPS